MSDLLSNTFPVMTDKEEAEFVRHFGTYKVSYYEPKVKAIVVRGHGSIECFMDKNGLSAEDRGAITWGLEFSGRYQISTDHGLVGIYRGES